MKKNYISVILIVFLLISGCRHKQYSFDDKKRICYRIIDTVNLTWSNAQQFCENDGGHLITLDLEDKNRFISNALQSCKFMILLICKINCIICTVQLWSV